jgi:hypothetical protein
VKEKIQYKTDLQIKTKASVFAFDASYAFDLTNTTSNLSVTTNWGDIHIENKARKLDLPDAFKGASVIREGSNSRYLEVVGWNNNTKQCIVSIWWRISDKWTRVFDDFNLKECSRMRITNVGRDHGTVVSYISNGDGDFNWFFLKNNTAVFNSWKKVKAGLFKKKYLISNMSHDVVWASQWIKSPTDPMTLVVFQKAADSSGYMYPRILTMKGSTSTKKFDDNSKFTFRWLITRWTDMISNKKGKIEAISWTTGCFNKRESSLWLTYIDDKGRNRRVYTDMDTNKLYTGKARFPEKKRWTSQNSADHRLWAGYRLSLMNYGEKPSSIYAYWELNTGGWFRICTPFEKTIYFKNSTSVRKDCAMTRSDDLIIAEDEYLDLVSIRTDGAAVLKIRTKGDITGFRDVIANPRQADIPATDTSKFAYCANQDVLFEYPKMFSNTSTPQISAYNDEIAEKEYWLFPKKSQKPSTVTLSAQDGPSKASHQLRYKSVSYFTVQDIDDTERYLSPTRYKYPIWFPSVNIIGQADEIQNIPDTTKPTWFSVTPMKQLSAMGKLRLLLTHQNADDKNPLRKVEETNFDFSVKSLEQVPDPDGPMEPALLCTFDKYYLYAWGGKLHSYVYRFDNMKNKRAFMVDLTYLNLDVTHAYCFNQDGKHLMVSKQDESIISTVSFDLPIAGHYQVRTFYETRFDPSQVNKVKYSKFGRRYTLFGEDGSIYSLDFKFLHPLMMVNDSSVKGGSVVVNGVTINFDFGNSDGESKLALEE